MPEAPCETALLRLVIWTWCPETAPRKPCPGGSLTSEACWSLKTFLFRLREDGAGEWMSWNRVRDWRRAQEPPFARSREPKLFGQLRLAVGKRSGFVENGSAAGGNLFEGHGVFDNDGTSRRQRDGTNDGDWNGNEQWTRRSDDQHGEKADSFTTKSPSQEREHHGQRRVNSPQLISEPPQPRPVVLGFPHYLHDFGVAGIHRRRVAMMVRAASPFTAPEMTMEPGALVISNGSPVRKASFMTPLPSITVPSTGQMSCG